MPLLVTRQVFEQTFDRLRSCGGGRRECQALWVGSWQEPGRVTRLVHPQHSASAVSFALDEAWLTGFWTLLAQTGEGVRVQIHTHPGAAFHSATDNAFPIVFTPGFLSLVIPRFARGPANLDNAFLAQFGEDRCWREVAIAQHLEIV